eukprot:CAMPEP_0119353152 /NCGR_PEP_ID=MMETSP1334-20130426/2377_1 /TAXON_ID=127549 /ORGANISM="Calcidiscus leptoporus, Strain RCC1130" /LENGTH=451 /DNA_ID=CAMNT_0007366383 /DNA_START=449 /DNA_END=1806 /DNA_ORIENTATION=+
MSRVSAAADGYFALRNVALLCVVNIATSTAAGRHTKCAQERPCKFQRPTCQRNHTLERHQWGGIGNTLPIYTGYAKQAFLENCTIKFLKIPGRSFQLQQHFLEPKLIPRARLPAAECAGIALTSNPSEEVAERVQAVHEALHTAEVRSGSGALRAHATQGGCCDRPKCMTGQATGSCPPVLIALHIRTFWADYQEHADSYGCAAPSLQQRATAADEVHALFQSPAGLGKFVPVTRSPTLQTVVDAAVAAARHQFGHNASLSLFVASDSEATRELAVAHARNQHGLRAAYTNGHVRHNNLPSLSNKTDVKSGAAVAMADLLLLSQADMILVLGAGSTFPNSAQLIARCNQHRDGTVTYYMGINPLARGLFRKYRNDSYVDTHGSEPETPPPDCLRDCLHVDPRADRPSNSSTQPLLALIKEGHHNIVRAMSPDAAMRAPAGSEPDLGPGTDL